MAYILHSGLIVINQERLLKSLSANLSHKVIHERYWSQDLESYATKVLTFNDEIGHIRQQIRMLDTALPRERTLRIYGLDENIDAFFETEISTVGNVTYKKDENKLSLEQFFQHYFQDYLGIKMSLAEIETIERIGIDTHLDPSHNHTDHESHFAGQNEDHSHGKDEKCALAPRPMRIFLSNGHTTKKLITEYSKIASNLTNDYNYDTRISLVPDKARGWVNLYQIAEHCTCNFTLNSGKFLGKFKAYDFVAKKNIPTATGAAFFTQPEGNFITMQSHSGSRSILKFGDLDIFTRYMEYQNSTLGKKTILKDVEPEFQHYIFKEHTAPFVWSGTDHVYYEGSVYYVRYNTSTIIRYDLNENKLKKAKTIEDAEVDISGGECQFESNHKSSSITLKLDETGLWVLYCTAASNGLLIIGKLDHINLEVRRKFSTSLRKVWLENCFISCGVLYGIRRYNNDHIIKYVYNTHTLSSNNIYIPLIVDKKDKDGIGIYKLPRIASVSFVPKFSHSDKIDSSLVIWDERGNLFSFEINYGFYSFGSFLEYHDKVLLKYLP